MFATSATDADDIEIAAKVDAIDLNAEQDYGANAPEQEPNLDDGLWGSVSPAF